MAETTYSGVITISVNDFSAPSFADAEKLMEKLIDALVAGTEETDTLRWDTVDWETQPNTEERE